MGRAASGLRNNYFLPFKGRSKEGMGNEVNPTLTLILSLRER